MDKGHQNRTRTFHSRKKQNKTKTDNYTREQQCKHPLMLTEIIQVRKKWRNLIKVRKKESYPTRISLYTENYLFQK